MTRFLTAPGRRCGCGSPEVMAIEVGQEAETFGAQADLFTVTRPVADTHWCMACWTRRFGARRAA